MRLEDQVGEVLTHRVSQVEVPPPDVADVVRRGRALRRRRRLRRDGLVTLVVVAVAATALTHVRGDRPGTPAGPLGPGEPQELRPVGALELGDGLRAVGSPDGGVLLGGRTIATGEAPDLDTAATATPYGMVFFDQAGHARLLGPDGRFADLGGPTAPEPSGYRPTSRSDAALPLVAFTLPREGGVSVVLHDLEHGERVAALDLDCDDCGDVAVDAVDEGLVFVRTGEGTSVWAPAAGTTGLTRLGDGDFRLADARGGRLLWSGAPPTPEAGSPVAGWPTTEGAIDSTLSFDGGHVLAWSNVLQPTSPGGDPVRLDVQAAFYAFDTDGSVLAATLDGTQSTVYDCVVPSGRCERVGTVPTTSGDPVFLGADM